jgi:hypothetical protein
VLAILVIAVVVLAWPLGGCGGLVKAPGEPVRLANDAAINDADELIVSAPPGLQQVMAKQLKGAVAATQNAVGKPGESSFLGLWPEPPETARQCADLAQRVAAAIAAQNATDAQTLLLVRLQSELQTVQDWLGHSATPVPNEVIQGLASPDPATRTAAH